MEGRWLARASRVVGAGASVLRESCCAEEIRLAVMRALPAELPSLMERCRYVGLVLGHDSHKANIRYVDSMLVARNPDH